MYRERLEKNDLFIDSAVEIDQICQPLKSIDITIFSYSKKYLDGSQIYLSSSPQWVDDYFNLNLWKSSLYELNSQHYKSGFFLWPQESQLQVFLRGKDFFNSSNGITVIEQSKDFCEFYFFSGEISSVWLPNFYLNNIDMLQKFIIHFKMKAQKIIQAAEKNRIVHFLPPLHQLTPSEIAASLSGDNHSVRKDFLRSLYSDNATLDKRHLLTEREKQISEVLLHGCSAKKIALQLEISYRTVEIHIENIKRKLNCNKKSELIKLLMYS